MTIQVALQHRTLYRFDHPVRVHPHTVRLRPAPHSRTPIRSYSLTVEPHGHFVNWQQDPFGNYLARLVFPEPVSLLDISVDLVADMTVINPFDFFVEDYAETFPFTYPPALAAELAPYRQPVDETVPGSGPGPMVLDWIGAHSPLTAPGQRIVDFLVGLNRAVQSDVAYTVRLEAGVQTPDRTLGRAVGSCRDSAWLLVSVLRRLGLAARFVSGYLVQLVADEVPVDGPAGPASDFTDLHAWAEVYVPGAGWIGLDATSGLLAGEGHIPLSATPTPASSAPITGSTDVVGVEMEFVNSVTRIHEDPRVTRPYSPAQWRDVDRLGRHIDARLLAGDVRLTMGGEPTFVARGDTSSAQWNFAADGDEKRTLAGDLAGRLFAEFAAGGVVQHGQGKWYPGEPLPRWQIQLSWRSDGLPLWANPALLADPYAPSGAVGRGIEASADVVRDLALGIGARLGVAAEFCRPAYEDTLHQVWRDALVPFGDRPRDADPEADGTSSAALLAEADAAAGSVDPTGWVVPLFRDPDGERWATTRWRTRRRHLFLTPGSSPMGLRLPLDSIAWTPPPDTPDRSPFEPRDALAPPASGLPGALADTLADVPPAVVHDVESSPRFALCVQERKGLVHVFLPPQTHLEHLVGLLAAIEAAAAALSCPIVLEGYGPPNDPRLHTLSVTPDPGVIEVNVQPSADWPALCEVTTKLVEAARHTGLATEKFDVDGTHTGTGGGNHLTLGGSTPADSPLLRRPDLLRSLVTYWQHHPALSYVFSGRFIGPTSQSPRVDESRYETLYELETAFAELDRMLARYGGEDEVRRQVEADTRPDPGETYERRQVRQRTSVPWLTDRLLRNLLTDVTGNTHRSEFCIDKLYDPATARGRLGLLELRGFEMPPHPQMALVQALLVRSLVGRFWAEPYGAPLVAWGTRLHDRFLLPAFAAADLHDVVADLNRFLAETTPIGAEPAAFDKAWLDPFLEFRFPRLGETTVAGVHLELRQGIEPWHVLGEEVTGSGTSRFVDSSVERVQVAVRGLVTGRHVVTCNGVPVPLTEGPDGAAMVGGVRYRAWAPPSALHPTIGVHSPLVFDVVDRWNARSLGGFTYHVVHPGGRSYDTYPVNAVEAESRRAARFVAAGHTPGPVDVTSFGAVWTASAEYPCTLDLRRFSPGR